MFKQIAAVFLAIILGVTTISAQPTDDTKWTWTGWGGGGFFWCAAFDPADAQTLYMGGDVIGMYKSVDRGQTWKIINNGLHNYGVYSVVVAPSNPKVVYVMTTNGMARSDNGGELWIPLKETMNNAKKISINRHGSIRAIAVDPTNAAIVYAGSGTGELFKSINAGETWQRLDYAAAPTNQDETVKAAHGDGFLLLNYQAPSQDWARHGRIEKFIAEKGENWSNYSRLTAKVYLPPNTPKITGQIAMQTGDAWTWQETPPVEMEPGQWTELDYDLKTVKELNSVRLLHIVFRANGQAVDAEIGIDDAVLTSADGKQTRRLGDWEEANNWDGWRLPTATDGGFARGLRSSATPLHTIPGPIASVTVAPTNPNLLFVAHSRAGLFRSEDGGITWTRPQAPLRAANVAVYVKDAQIVYGAFETAGIWKSTDGGMTWAETSKMPGNSAVREIVIDPRNPDKIRFIALQSWNGYYGSSDDGGKNWTTGRSWTRDQFSNPTLSSDSKKQTDPLSTPTNLAMSPAEPDTLFISANWTNILSTDGGVTWKQRDQGADITCFYDLQFVDGSAFAVAMDEGLFRSDDNGATWQHILPYKYEEGINGHQWRVRAQRRPDGQFRIVVTVSPWRAAQEFPNAVLVSEDDGKTWKRGTGLPNYIPKMNTMWEQGYPRALAVDPQNPSTMYLGIDGDPETGNNGGGIFKSTDGGLSWKQLPNQPGSRRMFQGVAVDPKNSNRLYWGAGGNNEGLWMSEDAGESWKKADGVTNWVFNVETAPSGAVFAGSNNLWKSVDSGKTWQRLTDFKTGTVMGIAIDPQDENRIWCSLTTWDASDQGGIFRSLDGGKTWKEITGDIPYRKPIILRYNPQTKELWAFGVGAFKTQQ